MGKIINSNSILALARKKSKELKLAFDDFHEIADLPVIEQMLFFAFLNMEMLYRNKQLSQEAKKHYQAVFEAKSQEFAAIIYPAERLYLQCEQDLQRALRNEDYMTAAELLSSMLDYSRAQVFEGKYKMMLDAFLERSTPDYDDI